MARLSGLAAVIDPRDHVGAKNRLIDSLHKRALSRELGSLHGQRVLDYGCGVGRLSAWVAAQGGTVVGADPSVEMLGRAREHVPDARFVQVPPDSGLREVGDDFDVVLTVNVLQYIVGDTHRLRSTLIGLRDVLRDGGRLAVLEQVQDSGRDQGAPRATYESAFTRAGFRLETRRIVRLGHSSLLRLVARRPRIAGIPGLELAMELEARHRMGTLVDGRYADYLFLARKSSPFQ